MPRKKRGKGGEKEEEFDWRTALREIYNDKEEMENSSKWWKEAETVHKEHNERNVGKEKEKTKTTVTMATSLLSLVRGANVV